VTLAIRPERIGVAQASRSGAEPRGPNCLVATVREALYAGSETQYTVESARQVLRVRVPITPDGAPGWQAGERVEVHLPATALTVLED
jgi:ABC-type Fe3+/spermidine/putrescine transport system ATPase subunit